MPEQSNENDEIFEPPQKKKRIHKQFVYEQSFDSVAEIWEKLKEENCWSKYYISKSDDGGRQIIRCNKVAFRGPQCAARLYYLIDSSTKKVHLYRATDEHDHEDNVNAVYEIPLETKEAIKLMYKYGVTKPKRILNQLTLDKIELPERGKFDSFLKQLRTEKFGAMSINMVELKRWLEDNSAIPSVKTEPFIAAYDISLDEKNPYFRFFVSSKELLANAVNVKTINADGTYKLIWQGYPVLQIGTTDMHRSFHKFGIAVCTNERTEDFEFLFAAVKNSVKNIFNIDHAPKVLISDAAKAIHNGFERVHGEPELIVMCWAHMRRNVGEKLPTYTRDKKKISEILADIDKLQLSKSNEVFDKAAVFFVAKWEKVVPEFMEYFQSEWLQKNRFWYEGARHFTASTNNALESDNRVIKEEYSLGVRYDLAHYRSVLFKIIETCSLNYVDGTKEIHSSPEIELKLWTNAYVWAKNDVSMTVSEDSSHIIYQIPAGRNQVEQTGDWNSFDEFKKINFQSNHVSFPKPLTRTNWIDGRCDCSDFFKIYTCVHILGIALRMKFIIAPDEAKALPLGQKRKRGRPALAKAALVVQ